MAKAYDECVAIVRDILEGGEFPADFLAAMPRGRAGAQIRVREAIIAAFLAGARREDIPPMPANGKRLVKAAWWQGRTYDARTAERVVAHANGARGRDSDRKRGAIPHQGVDEEKASGRSGAQSVRARTPKATKARARARG